MRFGKEKNIATFIIGHITKEGSIAGPRVLEHMVDTVLYFEGDSSRELRLLRGFKNRFGTTSEVGIFEMTKVGLVSAKDVSKKVFYKRKSASRLCDYRYDGRKPPYCFGSTSTSQRQRIS